MRDCAARRPSSPSPAGTITIRHRGIAEPTGTTSARLSRTCRSRGDRASLLHVVLQLDDNHFHRFLATVEVAVLLPRRIDAQPVGLHALPRHLLHRLPVAIDDVERAALERDDR